MKVLESLALTQEPIENCYRFLRKERYNESEVHGGVPGWL